MRRRQQGPKPAFDGTPLGEDSIEGRRRVQKAHFGLRDRPWLSYPLHPKGFVEDNLEDDADPAAVPAPPPGATQGKPGSMPDPAESEEDDEER
jgi:hypothetical protein